MIQCTKCMEPLHRALWNTTELVECPSCHDPIHVDAFPALLQGLQEGTAGEFLLTDDESGCFFHPNKKAVISCSNCGRFLCALCDVEFGDSHLCTSCLESGKKKHKIKNLENHRTLYDNIALSMAVIPLIVWFITIITAPLSLILVIRYWKAPSSIILRTKIRFIIAFIIGFLQITGWVIGIFALIT